MHCATTFVGWETLQLPGFSEILGEASAFQCPKRGKGASKDYSGEVLKSGKAINRSKLSQVSCGRYFFFYLLKKHC